MTLLPVEFERDKAAWVRLREMQAWEEGVSMDEVQAVLGMPGKPRSSQLKLAGPGGRVYPRYFCPVVVREERQTWLRPLRYTLRPAGSYTELSSKYQLFNARLDTILEKRTWKGLIGRRHGILPFTSFYEWVAPKGKSVEIQFMPQGKEIIWAPVLWDRWSSLGGELEFDSCSMITDEPPPEVAAAGHDRSPIFLAGDAVDQWLNPESQSPQEWKEFLSGHRDSVHYDHRMVA
ncbi:SOS response-associated peptidase family protein [Microbulbifer aggregans]|uniref:SOS response-associated peptidase family protein n=1 Tax=Microbulbifer aggregans TaxID=1769779 RepID=UPI001CFC789B|nr:SOS response-associated peptidase family protein [Microbulbifer aggregans]